MMKVMIKTLKMTQMSLTMMMIGTLVMLMMISTLTLYIINFWNSERVANYVTFDTSEFVIKASVLRGVNAKVFYLLHYSIALMILSLSLLIQFKDTIDHTL